MKTIRKRSAAPNGEPPKKPPEYVKGSGNLVGMVFHVLNYKGHVHNQGYFIDRIGERHYLARFFDFLLGEPNAIEGFDIDEIFGRYRNGLPKFQLYTSVEAMEYEYQYGVARPPDGCKSLQDTPLKRPSGFPYDPDNPFDPDNEPSDPATWPNAGNHVHKKDVTK